MSSLTQKEVHRLRLKMFNSCVRDTTLRSTTRSFSHSSFQILAWRSREEVIAMLHSGHITSLNTRNVWLRRDITRWCLAGNWLNWKCSDSDTNEIPVISISFIAIGQNIMDKAGRSTRKMAARRGSADLTYLILALGVAIALFIIATDPQAWSVTGLGLSALIIGLRFFGDLLTSRAERLFKAEKRAVGGARSEETIERILDSLGSNFYALHDLERPYGNVDHVVLSRSNGVFLIETKAHGGKVEVLDDRLAS